MGCIVSVTIGLLTLIKKPIKKLTAKIKNERVRKLVNKIFILFAFGISAGIWFFLNIIAPVYFSIEAVEIVLTGALSIVIYALADGVITKNKAQILIDQLTETIEQTETKNTKTKKEKSNSAVQEYLKKVKK